MTSLGFWAWGSLLMRYGHAIIFAIAVLLGSGAAARADDACANPDALGVARVQEIDTAGGVQVGDLQYSHSLSFLGDKEVVLTFDDGPFPSTTPEILATLAEQCTKATFFYVGKMALQYPDILEQVDKAGHTIGAHTWGHANLRKLTPARASVEIEKGVGMLEARLGHPIAPFFRFPYLSDPKIDIKYLLGRDFGVFSTDVDSWDSHGLTPSDRIVKYVMTRLKEKGHGIVLLHDIKHTTAHALPEILKQLKDGGYKIVHLVPKAPAAPLQMYADWAKKMIDRQDLANVAVASNGKRKPKIEEIPFDVAEAGTPATPEAVAGGGKRRQGNANQGVVELPAGAAGTENGLVLPEKRGRQTLSIASLAPPTTPAPIIVASLAPPTPPKAAIVALSPPTPAPAIVAAPNLKPTVEPKSTPSTSVAAAIVTPPPAPIAAPKPAETIEPKPAKPAPVVVAAATPSPMPIVPQMPVAKLEPRLVASAPVVVAAVTPAPAPVIAAKPVVKVEPKPAAPTPAVLAAAAPTPIAPQKPVAKLDPKPVTSTPVVVAVATSAQAPIVAAKSVEPKVAAPAPVAIAAATPTPIAPQKPVAKLDPKPVTSTPVVVATATPAPAPNIAAKPVEKVEPNRATPAPVVVAAAATSPMPIAPQKPVANLQPKPIVSAPVVVATVTPAPAPIIVAKPLEKVEPKPAAAAPVVVAAAAPSPVPIAPQKPVANLPPKPVASAPVVVAAVTPPPAPIIAANPLQKIAPKPAAPAPAVVAAVPLPSVPVAVLKPVENVLTQPAAVATSTPVPVVIVAPKRVENAPPKPATPPPIVVASAAPTPKLTSSASADLPSIKDTAVPAKASRRVLPTVTRLATADVSTGAAVAVTKPNTAPKPAQVVAVLPPPANVPLPVKVAPPRRALRPLRPTADATAQADPVAPPAAKLPKRLALASLDAAPKKLKALRPLKTVPAWIAINDTPKPGASHNSSRN